MNPVDLFRGATSFRQGETDRTQRIWRAEIPPGRDFVVSVHRHRDYPPELWMMSCDRLGLQHLRLNSHDVEQAKIEALMLVREKLSNFQDRIRAALGLTDALQPASPAPASTPPPDPSAQPPFD